MSKSLEKINITTESGKNFHTFFEQKNITRDFEENHPNEKIKWMRRSSTSENPSQFEIGGWTENLCDEEEIEPDKTIQDLCDEDPNEIHQKADPSEIHSIVPEINSGSYHLFVEVFTESGDKYHSLYLQGIDYHSLVKRFESEIPTEVVKSIDFHIATKKQLEDLEEEIFVKADSKVEAENKQLIDTTKEIESLKKSLLKKSKELKWYKKEIKYGFIAKPIHFNNPIIPTDTDSPEQIESRERRELINRLADCSQHLKGLIKSYDQAHKHQDKNINELVEAIDENRMSKNVLKDAVNHLSENIQTMERESDDKTKYLVDHLRRMEISNQLLAREIQLNTDALLYKPKKITTMDKLRAGVEVAKLLFQTINNYREVSKENKRYYRG